MSNPVVNTIADVIRRNRLIDSDVLDDCLRDLAPGGSGDDFLQLLQRKGHLTSWQASRLHKGERDGYSIGGYVLLYRIASGSFGRVFRGVDPSTGTVVAVKVLRQTMSESPHMVELFLREGKVGMTLQHPNIVRILGVGRDSASGKYFIAMEFVEGGNLRDILRIRKKLSALEAVKIIEECAAGLAYALSRGLTHRDMKTTNILLSSTGVCKLVDFGLAEVHGPAADDDDMDVDRTVDYAALERATNVKTGDPRSDIYFLGCVFYEMLTGRRPVPPTKDKFALKSVARYRDLPPIQPNEVEAPQSVFKLLDRMIAFQPTDRWQSPGQLHEAVRRVQSELEGHAVTALEPSGPRTIFVVEGNERIQDAMREKLKALGFRVLISADPARAEARYKEMPYHSLVIDAGTAGEEGLEAFRRIRREADDNNFALASVLLLSEEQAAWAGEVPEHPSVGVLVRPISLRQLYLKLQEVSGEPTAS
jgi:serine/threonine protein kinase